MAFMKMNEREGEKIFSETLQLHESQHPLTVEMQVGYVPCEKINQKSVEDDAWKLVTPHIRRKALAPPEDLQLMNTFSALQTEEKQASSEATQLMDPMLHIQMYTNTYSDLNGRSQRFVISDTESSWRSGYQ